MGRTRERAGRSEHIRRLALGGVVLWWIPLLTGPALRPDLNALTTHPETYATGEWGFLMRFGYLGAAIAAGAASVLARPFRVSALLLAVFAVGAFGLGLLPPTGADSLADHVFPYLQLSPLAYFPAIASISWRTRRRPLLALAFLAWTLFLPLVIGEPPIGGLINRAADLVMGAWIAAFALDARHVSARHHNCQTSQSQNFTGDTRSSS